MEAGPTNGLRARLYRESPSATSPAAPSAATTCHTPRGSPAPTQSWYSHPRVFERVLTAYDGSAASRAGLEFSLELARAFGSRVTVVHVLEPERAVSESSVDRAPPDPEEARGWLSELCERRSTAGFPALAPVTLEEGRPASAVLELADRERPDLIVVGRTGRHGLAGFLFGSVAERLVRGAPCPVAVFPAEATFAMHPRVLAGYDGSVPSREALRVASVLAAALSAGLLVIHVVDYRVPFAGQPTDSARELVREEGEGLLNEGCSVLSAPLESVETELREGDPRSGLHEAVREHRPRLLVLGHRGSGGFPGLGLGSTAGEAVRAAECPVLVVKSAAAGGDE